MALTTTKHNTRGGMQYSSTHKRDLAEQINRLEKHEQEDIFMILKSHAVFFSRNTNGIFINMKNLTLSIMNEIESYLDSVDARKARMAEFQDSNSIVTESEKDARDAASSEKRSSSEGSSSNFLNQETAPMNFKIIKLPDDQELLVAQFIDNIDVDKPVHKKTSHHSKFQTAKKKYSRPCNRGDEIVGMGLLTKQEYIM